MCITPDVSCTMAAVRADKRRVYWEPSEHRAEADSDQAAESVEKHLYPQVVRMKLRALEKMLTRIYEGGGMSFEPMWNKHLSTGTELAAALLKQDNLETVRKPLIDLFVGNDMGEVESAFFKVKDVAQAYACGRVS